MAHVTCGTCGYITEYSEVLAGSAGKCQRCHALLRYPGGSEQRRSAIGLDQQGKFHSGAAAVLSLFIPGVGQMCQRRWISGCLYLLLVPLGYVAFIVPGLVLHIICIVDAATN